MIYFFLWGTRLRFRDASEVFLFFLNFDIMQNLDALIASHLNSFGSEVVNGADFTALCPGYKNRSVSWGVSPLPRVMPNYVCFDRPAHTCHGSLASKPPGTKTAQL